MPESVSGKTKVSPGGEMEVQISSLDFPRGVVRARNYKPANTLRLLSRLLKGGFVVPWVFECPSDGFPVWRTVWWCTRVFGQTGASRQGRAVNTIYPCKPTRRFLNLPVKKKVNRSGQWAWKACQSYPKANHPNGWCWSFKKPVCFRCSV